MTFRKIAGPIRLVSCAQGADVDLPLPPRPGARMCKLAQYTMKIESAGGTAPKLGFKLRHGPNGIVSKEIVNAATAAVVEGSRGAGVDVDTDLERELLVGLANVVVDETASSMEVYVNLGATGSI